MREDAPRIRRVEGALDDPGGIGRALVVGQPGAFSVGEVAELAPAHDARAWVQATQVL
jgi:hypothetical protein